MITYRVKFSRAYHQESQPISSYHTSLFPEGTQESYYSTA